MHIDAVRDAGPAREADEAQSEKMTAVYFWFAKTSPAREPESWSFEE